MLALLKIWTSLLRILFMPSFFGIGFGPNAIEKKSEKGLEGIAGFGTSRGEGAISNVLNFDNALLSGDMGKIAQLMAPFTTAINKQAGEQQKTTAEFGNRGGGTNASMQAVNDSVRGTTYDEIAKLISGAKSEEANLGTNLLGTGASSYEGVFGEGKTMADQNKAKWNDIFNSISEIAGGVAGMPGIAGSTTGKVLTGVAGALG